MKSIALIHTVQTVATSFGDKLKDFLKEDISIHNLWDDFLANNPNEIGKFTIENRNRLFQDIKSAELTGADMIVVTCSTLTPIVNMIRPFIKVPLVAIDDAMGKIAVTYGKKILILATAESTIQPTMNKINLEAAAIGKKVEVEAQAVTEAFYAMKAMEMDRHDAILMEHARSIKDYDCIVLAQASMAHLANDIAQITGCPVLESPRLCMEQIKKLLEIIN